MISCFSFFGSGFKSKFSKIVTKNVNSKSSGFWITLKLSSELKIRQFNKIIVDSAKSGKLLLVRWFFDLSS